MGRVVNCLAGFLGVAFVVTLSLTIYYGIQECLTDDPTFNLQKAIDREVTGFPTDTKSFTYIVFTDPQLELLHF